MHKNQLSTLCLLKTSISLWASPNRWFSNPTWQEWNAMAIVCPQTYNFHHHNPFHMLKVFHFVWVPVKLICCTNWQVTTSWNIHWNSDLFAHVIMHKWQVLKIQISLTRCFRVSGQLKSCYYPFCNFFSCSLSSSDLRTQLQKTCSFTRWSTKLSKFYTN
jgi:hypothetical protein